MIQSIVELITERWKFFRGLAAFALLTAAAAPIVVLGFQRYFVEMPKDYAPPFEDLTSWLAWKIEQPVKIIYLSDEPRPHRVEYLINTRIANHTYSSGIIQDFAPEAVNPGQPTIIFVDTLRVSGAPVLDNPIHGFQLPVQYFHKDGYSFGFAITNTNVDLNPRVGLDDGWNSLRNYPVRGVLTALMVLLAVGILLGIRDLSRWPREEIVLEFGNPETDPARNFNFHMRIRIPARTQNRTPHIEP